MQYTPCNIRRNIIAILYSVILYSAILYSAILYSAILYSAILSANLCSYHYHYNTSFLTKDTNIIIIIIIIIHTTILSKHDTHISS